MALVSHTQSRGHRAVQPGRTQGLPPPHTAIAALGMARKPHVPSREHGSEVGACSRRPAAGTDMEKPVAEGAMSWVRVPGPAGIIDGLHRTPPPSVNRLHPTTAAAPTASLGVMGRA
ncbi:PH domain leucine-rich repeat-containing protein phosphatase 2 [Platysternon megacephalum]|uniref:PH domain leucine-rich repeat-containing protein phosphatase 2 n=1 Tax=Platysternon megacephalum TaxID=55544 RepID=A0A4D9EE37_9SAUR|nr:PH domain leucine-rich repeat-containing protein phosphatase 2 [Platysternon megacephalum]